MTSQDNASQPSAPPAETGTSSSAAKWVGWGEQISLCSRIIRDQISQAAARHGLSPIEFSVLFFCRPDGCSMRVSEHDRDASQGGEEPQCERSPGASQNQIAEAISVSAAHVSGLVEQLRSRGLLSGHRSTADRRRQHWRATEKGEAVLRAILEELAPWAIRLDQDLGHRQGERTFRLLGRLTDALLGLSVETPADAQHRGAA